MSLTSDYLCLVVFVVFVVFIGGIRFIAQIAIVACVVLDAIGDASCSKRS